MWPAIQSMVAEMKVAGFCKNKSNSNNDTNNDSIIAIQILVAIIIGLCSSDTCNSNNSNHGKKKQKNLLGLSPTPQALKGTDNHPKKPSHAGDNTTTGTPRPQHNSC